MVTLALCGDVMLGRGVDQVLAEPGDPALQETWVKDARDYVAMAEKVNGRIPRPVAPDWVWGEALPALAAESPDARVVNLETSVTTSDDFAIGKAVHYRMSPANLGALSVARPDVCTLANNHVLDFGRRGLLETLASLGSAGLRTAGAGRDLAEAQRPAVVPLPGGGRLVVLSFGMPSSGIPDGWAATARHPGVDLVDGPSEARAAAVVDRVNRVKRPGDIVLASVHWGSNWGYDVSRRQVRFAHRLVEGGVDVVHGHSSHHPRPVEVYRDRLVLYGCGDFIDDYEGIAGFENFRDDLRLLYVVSVRPGTGELEALRMLPFQARRLRLHRAADADVRWLRATLDQVSRDFGTRVGHGPDGVLMLRRS